MSGLPQITGNILVTQHREQDGAPVTYAFEWRGGDVIGLAKELLAEADPAVLQRNGERITIGPYQVRIIAADEHTVYALRVAA